MKFLIEQTALITLIQPIAGIVPSKNTMAILTNFLIEADEVKGKIKITATDLEISVVVECEASVSQAGKVAVSAKSFTEIIHAMPQAPIVISYEEDYLTVSSGYANFKLLCADYTQYPDFPAIEMSEALTMDAFVFSKMIKATSFAVSTEANRAIFTGVYWKITPENQLMVATDGKKIAEFIVNEANPVIEDKEQIIPTKGLLFLMKVIADKNLPLRFIIEEKRVVFSFEQYTIITHTLEGRYPDYAKAIPSSHDKKLIIDKNTLARAIQRVALLASDENNRIKFSLENSRLELTSADREKGDARDVLENIAYEGEPLVIAFNFRFIAQILNVLEDEKAEILLGKDKEPILIYNAAKNEKYTSRYLVMPLRTS